MSNEQQPRAVIAIIEDGDMFPGAVRGHLSSEAASTLEFVTADDVEALSELEPVVVLASYPGRQDLTPRGPGRQRRIHQLCPDVAIVAMCMDRELTGLWNPEHMWAYRFGASAVCTFGQGAAEWIHAIEELARNRFQLQPQIAGQMLAVEAARATHPGRDFATRTRALLRAVSKSGARVEDAWLGPSEELERAIGIARDRVGERLDIPTPFLCSVIDKVAQGMGVEDIAAEFRHTSIETIKSAIAEAKKRMGVDSREQLILAAAGMGLLSTRIAHVSELSV